MKQRLVFLALLLFAASAGAAPNSPSTGGGTPLSPQNTLGLHGTLTPGHGLSAYSSSTIQDSGSPAGGGQTPWTSNIDGAGYYLKDANIWDAGGLNGADLGISVDAINHALWSTTYGSSKIPFIDYSGNGGGGPLQSGWYMAFDRGEHNVSFSVPIADTNFNSSLDTDQRKMWDGSNNISMLYGYRQLINANGVQPFDWSGTFQGNTVGMSFDSSNNVQITQVIYDANNNQTIDPQQKLLIGVNGSTVPTIDYSQSGQNQNAALSFDGFNAWFHDIYLEYGNSIHLASGGGGGIDGVNQISANSFQGGGFSGDGSGLYNLNGTSVSCCVPYSNLYGAPMDGSGTMQTGFNDNGNGTTFYGTMNINGTVVSNSSTGITTTVTTAVCGTQNGQIQFANGIAIYAQDCIP